MNEIRKDYLLDRWVILSPKRSKRPEQFKKQDLPVKDENCIFCPGNEEMTTKSIIEKPHGNWRIRLIENKFPALTKECKFQNFIEGFKNRMTGYGRHYILIDTAFHNQHPCDYTANQWQSWFETISDIFFMEMPDENIKYISVFKNHGVEAGASQPHPHTQIISMPLVPFLIKQEIDKAKEYYNFNGKCAFCDIIQLELKNKKRIVFQNDEVVVLCPFAPSQPYEVWVFPRKHVPSIQIGKKTRDEILKAVSNVLKAYYIGLNDKPFNLMFHILYPKMEEKQSYHFHIEILPRIERDAGLELGSGINITTVTPEESARFLRKFFK
ncbi:MAG: galactose-1-phosphate uridylyltransferase [Candidatus Aenigmatarchaeota archaeon]|nr:galactose-1-phosphate uridylyltransferase [Candidatus Aenigmarchaeota archaeon]